MPNEIASRIEKLLFEELLSAAEHGNTLEMKSHEMKAQLFDLAKYCQINLDQTRLISETCGAFQQPICSLFGDLGLLCLLTEPKRRQVYFAVMAAIETDQGFDDIAHNTTARAELLAKFFTASNEALIASAYKSCPNGFIALLGRLGEQARAPATYRRLFDLLNTHDTLAEALIQACQNCVLDDDLIELVSVLPPTWIGVKAGLQFGSLCQYHRFMRPYSVITQSSEISDAHLHQLAGGASPSKLINTLFMNQSFQAPALEAPGLTYIANGRMLKRTAKRFSNCLANYLALALTNRRQFYIWRHDPSNADIVFAISNDQPFGWYLSEAKLPQNASLSVQQRDALKTLLLKHNVRVGGSLRSLMLPFHQQFRENEAFLDLEDDGFEELDPFMDLDDVA